MFPGLSIRPRPRAAPDLRLPFRLRHLLGVVLFVWLASLAVPRIRAVFRLHTAVTAYADYAMCLVGPTGPELLRSGSGELGELLRARVVGAGPSDRPFADCRRLAEQLGLRSASLLAEPASLFFEYFDEPRGGPSVRELNVELTPLVELNELAWPFGLRDPLSLIVPSRHAKEAPHPGSLPEPVNGSGLPVPLGALRSSAAFGDVFYLAVGSGVNRTFYVSSNRGVTFRAARPSGGELAEERCGDGLDGRSFSLVLGESDDWLVLSRHGQRAGNVATLVPASHRLLAVDCDDHHLLALTESGALGSAMLQLCAFEGACRALVPPRLGARNYSGRVDAALLDGDIVLSLATGGLTRVTSSRDGGMSWTPWTLAFDERRMTQRFSSRPDRLLRVGADLLLLGGVRGSSEPYPVLLSSDHGASFWPPRSEAADGSPLTALAP